MKIEDTLPERKLVQVCYLLSPVETREREIKALVKANQRMQMQELLIITMNHEETIREGETEIKVIPAWKWLLQDEVT